MKAKRNPTRAPTNSDGAKVPPTPPAPLVAEVAKALNIAIAPMNMAMNHTFSRST